MGDDSMEPAYKLVMDDEFFPDLVGKDFNDLAAAHYHNGLGVQGSQ